MQPVCQSQRMLTVISHGRCRPPPKVWKRLWSKWTTVERMVWKLDCCQVFSHNMSHKIVYRWSRSTDASGILFNVFFFLYMQKKSNVGLRRWNMDPGSCQLLLGRFNQLQSSRKALFFFPVDAARCYTNTTIALLTTAVHDMGSNGSYTNTVYFIDHQQVWNMVWACFGVYWIFVWSYLCLSWERAWREPCEPFAP